MKKRIILEVDTDIYSKHLESQDIEDDDPVCDAILPQMLLGHAPTNFEIGSALRAGVDIILIKDV